MGFEQVPSYDLELRPQALLPQDSQRIDHLQPRPLDRSHASTQTSRAAIIKTLYLTLDIEPYGMNNGSTLLPWTETNFSLAGRRESRSRQPRPIAAATLV